VGTSAAQDKAAAVCARSESDPAAATHSVSPQLATLCNTPFPFTLCLTAPSLRHPSPLLCPLCAPLSTRVHTPPLTPPLATSLLPCPPAPLQLLKEVAGTQVYEERRRESLSILEDTDGKRRGIDEVRERERGGGGEGGCSGQERGRGLGEGGEKPAQRPQVEGKGEAEGKGERQGEWRGRSQGGTVRGCRGRSRIEQPRCVGTPTPLSADLFG